MDGDRLLLGYRDPLAIYLVVSLEEHRHETQHVGRFHRMSTSIRMTLAGATTVCVVQTNNLNTH